MSNNLGMPPAPDKTPQSCALVVFGASGDLTQRKLIPALYNLAAEKWLPDRFALIGVAKDDLSAEDFRKNLGRDIEGFLGEKVDADVWSDLESRLDYFQGGFDDPKTYERIAQTLEKLRLKNCVFYLAIPPSFISVVIENLGRSGLSRENGGFRRVVVEKPFGRDMDSARALNSQLLKTLEESQIYRIDHYLGKETVQNLMVFRFANGLFEPVWNHRYVNHVQITVSEDLGVERRGGYYEGAGALRDMMPSHLFQLLSLTAMEPPISFEADDVRDEQAKVLHAVKPLSEAEVFFACVRGQYGAGEIAGKKVCGYRQEPMVSPQSATETFCAMRLFIDNWRWAGIPFFLRTGKRMALRGAEIVIQFKAVPFSLFKETTVNSISADQIIIRIQPDEGISLNFAAKVPGPIMQLGTVNMSFNYSDYFGKKTVTGYERLLHDVIIGDATLFRRADALEAGWRIVNPILQAWASKKPEDFPNYAAGSWGPRAADDMIFRESACWRPCGLYAAPGRGANGKKP